MTTLRVAAVATTLLLLLPFTTATSSHSIFDEEGDESVRPIAAGEDVVEVHTAECEAPAADLRRVDIMHDGSTLTLTLSVASLSSLEYECDAFALFSSQADVARWDVRLDELVGDDVLATSTRFLTAAARTTGMGIEGCVEIGFVDTATDECLGTFSWEGNAMKWSIPLSGTVTVVVADDPSGVLTHEEARTYDLAGRSADLSVSSTVEDNGVFLQGMGLEIRDHVRAEGILL